MKTTVAPARHDAKSPRRPPPKAPPSPSTAAAASPSPSVLSQVQIICFLIGLCLVPFKALFMFMYRSTDFEVHRNWLAITYSLPLTRWYFEDRSEWTLDYPPFFAYFEWALAQAAHAVDPAIVDIDNLNYGSASCVAFQRCSVIAADALFVYGAYRCIAGPAAQLLSPSTRLTIFLLVVFNAGLLLVDHVHFQYNGALLGLLLLCADCVQRGQDSRLALYFSALVLAKHLFATLAPVVGVYLLRRALDRSVLSRTRRLSLPHLATILASHAAAVAVCLGAAFGPFVALGGVEQLRQMLTRLFPFARGLVHAYWAPNCWALYCAADKLLALLALRFPAAAQPLLRALPWAAAAAADGSAADLPPSTSGLVGDFALHVLPRVTATHCLLLVLLASAPAAVRLLRVQPATASKPRWQRQQFVLALRALVYASLSSFMLGYHVHEKALLPAWLLQTLLVAESTSDRVVFCLLSAAGSVALFPLIPGPVEWCVKVALTVAFHQLAWYLLDMRRVPLPTQRGLTACYAMLALLVLYTDVLHREVFDDRLPFLPLLLTSSVCALVLLTCWAMALGLLLAD